MATISIRDWSRSAPTGADLDRLFGPLYRRMMGDEPVTELLEGLCSALADDLPAALVAVARRCEGGMVAIEAAAPANDLWASLQSLPERSDGTVAGSGPAAAALNSGKPAWISISEEGFRPWRQAAAREHVAAGGAWPFRHAGQQWVLEIFSGDESLFQNGAMQRRIERLVSELVRFLDEARRWREYQLLARAMDQGGQAAFITNLSGEIEWTNRAFTALYGYSADEARGNTPRLLSSGKQGLRYYRDLWGTIRSGKVWSGETVDRGKDGVDHVVRQTVTPFGHDGRVTHYLSTHEDITDLAAKRAARERRMEVDEETGLMNSSRFDQAIDDAIAANEPFALALLSLRGFGDALAGLGNELGQALSAEFGARLREVLGPGCCAGARQPGEYRLLLPQVKVSDATLRRLVEALGQPFPMLGQPLDVKPRIAIARYPDDGRTRDELLRHADAELADQPMIPANRKLPAR